jgi:CheY-like chemotaxis protein
LTVCLAVAGKNLPSFAFLDVLFGNKPPIAPSDRLYQRILALDEEESLAMVEKHAKEHSVEETFDEVLLPALANTDADDRNGLVTDTAREQRLQLFRNLLDEIDETPPESEDVPPRILLIPAAREADEMAALMLAHLLRARQLSVHVLSAKLLAAESLESAADFAPPLICVCSLPPVSVLAARQLCKRLRARLPDTRLVIALLQAEDDEFTLRRKRLEKAGADEVLSTLTGTATKLAEFATLKAPTGS